MGTRTSLKRSGGISDAERNFVAQIVLDQPGELTPSQVHGLSKALRRSKGVIKNLIEDAQEQFRSNAGRYVDVHMQATEAALSSGSVAGLEVAQKGAQWAMERLSAEGARIIEPKVEGAAQAGPRVLIGIRVGAIDAAKPAETVDVTATEVK